MLAPSWYCRILCESSGSTRGSGVKSASSTLVGRPMVMTSDPPLIGRGVPPHATLRQQRGRDTAPVLRACPDPRMVLRAGPGRERVTVPWLWGDGCSGFSIGFEGPHKANQ